MPVAQRVGAQMRQRAAAWISACILVLGGAGCNPEDDSGHHWNLTLTGVDDACRGQPANYTEKLEYRVKLEGQDAVLAIGPDEFATGTINGCNLVYESVVWGEEFDDYEIKWRLTGSATINFGDGSCNPGNGTDWDGTEWFEVVNSEDPAIAPGCQYEIKTAGKYTGETK